MRKFFAVWFVFFGASLAMGVIINRNMPQTPIAIAARHGHMEAVKLLVQAGADVNKADKDGQLPLYWAAFNVHIEIVKLLLEKGADVDKANVYGETLLHMAVLFERRDVVQLLIDHGADVKKADKNGKTPLHLAAIFKLRDIMNLLVDHGANMDMPDKKGRTPRDLEKVRFQIFWNQGLNKACFVSVALVVGAVVAGYKYFASKSAEGTETPEDEIIGAIDANTDFISIGWEKNPRLQAKTSV